jgi:hypothetical protein
MGHKISLRGAVMGITLLVVLAVVPVTDARVGHISSGKRLSRERYKGRDCSVRPSCTLPAHIAQLAQPMARIRLKSP